MLGWNDSEDPKHFRIFVFGSSCSLEELTPLMKWLNDNAAGYYHTDFMSKVLDQVVENGMVTHDELFKVYISKHSIATQFRLVFSEWAPIPIKISDEDMIVDILERIAPIRIQPGWR